MTREELNEITQYEWDKFARRFPAVVSRNWLSKLLFIFTKDTAFRVWENGFLQGWNHAIDHENENEH